MYAVLYAIYVVVLIFESVNEKLKCDHSNKSHSAVLCYCVFVEII